jgi:hypothetical protein
MDQPTDDRIFVAIAALVTGALPVRSGPVRAHSSSAGRDGRPYA